MNEVLLRFVNETIRPVADKLAGLLLVPDQILNTVLGQGIPESLGTTAKALLSAVPWTDADYAVITPQEIVGSNSGGRVALTNHHVLGILRAVVALKGLAEANPSLGPLVGAVAVNPRV